MPVDYSTKPDRRRRRRRRRTMVGGARGQFSKTLEYKASFSHGQYAESKSEYKTDHGRTSNSASRVILVKLWIFQSDNKHYVSMFLATYCQLLIRLQTNQ